MHDCADYPVTIADFLILPFQLHPVLRECQDILDQANALLFVNRLIGLKNILFVGYAMSGHSMSVKTVIYQINKISIKFHFLS